MINKVDDILNFIGASLRWLYGYFFQLVLGHENFTFGEFLHGSEDKNDFVGKIGHRTINRIFSILVIAPLILIILKLIKKI